MTFHVIPNSAGNELDIGYGEHGYYFNFKFLQKKTVSVSMSAFLEVATTVSNNWLPSHIVKVHR